MTNARAILADYRDIGEAVWTRFNASRDQILWYYRELVNAFRQAGGPPLVEELDRVVRAIEELAAKSGTQRMRPARRSSCPGSSTMNSPSPSA